MHPIRIRQCGKHVRRGDEIREIHLVGIAEHSRKFLLGGVAHRALQNGVRNRVEPVGPICIHVQ